ncbi:UNVERIFIED_CONTAM: hypothetical protein Sangu_0984400 [Sesamum angustifolium]|uniref:Uncharacterized protein n=1 Tax=Sesamum angustifolium TaxID=2727405 RepID=A0AAW2PEZ3_9LAMI
MYLLPTNTWKLELGHLEQDPRPSRAGPAPPRGASLELSALLNSRRWRMSLRWSWARGCASRFSARGTNVEADARQILFLTSKMPHMIV